MAATIRELSRSVQSQGGRGSGVRVFRVHDNGSGANTISDMQDVFQLMGNTGLGDEGVNYLPDKGNAFPDFAGLRVTDFTLSAVDGHADLWEVAFTYEQYSDGMNSAPSSALSTLPNEIGYVEEAANIRAEFVNEWRRLPIAPDDGTPTDREDIRGIPIDLAGNPISVARNRMDLTLTETVAVPAFATYRGLRFTRNSAEFKGVAVGKLLYLGAQVRRTGISVYQVQHTFAEDDYYHLVQQPVVDQDGDPVLGDSGENAKTVYWIQPFPTLKDHGTLSSNF